MVADLDFGDWTPKIHKLFSRRMAAGHIISRFKFFQVNLIWSNIMTLVEKFQQTSIPITFHWFNQPVRYQLGSGLEIFTDEKTDFWQNTHYGFQRDDGHCLFASQAGDFSLVTQVEFRPQEKYDQCGLMIRIDKENWIKVSTEYENMEHSRLGSVVTNLGYSDWATQDIPSMQREMWYRISKNGNDFLLENSYDGQTWIQLRITHLHKVTDVCEAGVYACSPLGKDFWCRFKFLEISRNEWH
jgi:regulation of enolase protein 1 (concanavalin A-like superfamily)